MAYPFGMGLLLMVVSPTVFSPMVALFAKRAVALPTVFLPMVASVGLDMLEQMDLH